ncbi:uncharacterized protein PG998_001525 [Apiospora kogelbergensis]|uniref:uncharacterized protein n=1 Tax=Apiospora kogelbergensis TaxID=1337665 RepID=UPI003131F55D
MSNNKDQPLHRGVKVPLRLLAHRLPPLLHLPPFAEPGAVLGTGGALRRHDLARLQVAGQVGAEGGALLGARRGRGRGGTHGGRPSQGALGRRRRRRERRRGGADGEGGGDGGGHAGGWGQEAQGAGPDSSDSGRRRWCRWRDYGEGLLACWTMWEAPWWL